MLVRAATVWTPDGPRRDHTVQVGDEGRIEQVRPAVAGDPLALEGLLVPGLVNAHTHLELSGLGLVPGGAGLPAWVAQVMRSRDRASRQAAAQAAEALREVGTAVVCDVSNAGDTAALLQDAGLAGVVQVEVLGFGRADVPARVASIESFHGSGGLVRRRPAAHAPYSTAPAIVQAVVDWDGPGAASPPTVHVGESEAEVAFLRDGTGPFAALLDALGRDWRWFEAPGCSPVAWLDRNGWLGRLIVVHGVHTTAGDRVRLAQTGTAVCLCPRSNQHVEGRLPEAGALHAAGVPLCLGTDSLASSPDLDVLAEIPVLARAFPEVPVGVWLEAATAGGARALGFPQHGRIVPGARPGLLLLEVSDVAALAEAAPPRRWVITPQGRADGG